jgi:plasmid maintenance system antidote protein VapI
LCINGALHILHVGDWGVPTTVKNVTTDLLDEVQKVKGLDSDYALAKLLEVRTQTISSYRTGRTQMSDEMALRASRVLGRPAAPLFAQLAAARAKDPEVARVWTEAAKVLNRRHGK